LPARNIFWLATDEKMLETAKKNRASFGIGIAVALSGYIVIAAIEKNFERHKICFNV